MRWFIILIPIMVFASCKKNVSLSQKQDNHIIFNTSEGYLKIRVCQPGIVQAIFSNDNSFPPDTSIIVNNACSALQDFDLKENKEGFIISTKVLHIEVDKTTGAIAYSDHKGNVLLQETPNGRLFTRDTIMAKPVTNIEQHFNWSIHEALYGLGQHQNGIVNYRNHNIKLVQDNTVAIVPFLTSSRGYGILWENYSYSKYLDADTLSIQTTDSTRSGSLWSEVGDDINYYFIYGKDMDEVISGYRNITGKTPMYGKWAYGLIQCKEHYHTQEELLTVVKEYRKRNVPFDMIVQDWFYWDPKPWGSHYFDRERYPDPQGMINKVHDNNAKLMISVWAKFEPGSPNFKELKSSGMLYPPTYVYGDAQFYDAFHPQGRDIYWKQIHDSLYVKGIDAWWLDATEPEIGSLQTDSLKTTLDNYLGSGSKYLNAYSLMTSKAVYEGQRSVSEDQRVFVLTRSAFAGQQRYGSTTWSGDIHARWDVFKKQIAAGINMGHSGIPYWTTDIGGFFVFDYVGGNQNPEYQELFTRWYQFGTFCPIFRVHGSTTPREIYEFGDPGHWAYDTQLKFDKLRYRLMPYIYSLAWKVTNTGYTMMRGLTFDFNHDEKTKDIPDQYMFGSEFLVCPVTETLYHKDFTNLNFVSEVITNYTTDHEIKGIKADFYKGINFDEKVTSRIDPSIDADWKPPLLPAGMPEDSFTIRYNGKLVAPETGEYTFVTYADDGVRLWIDDKLIINDWTQHAPEFHTGKINLKAGKTYPIKMEYLELIGGAVVSLKCILPSRDIGQERKAFEERSKKVQSKSVYLPKGPAWYNFWNGKVYQGGQQLDIPAPITEMPLFVKSGSIVPMGPFLQYATEKPADTLEIRIYAGNDGKFTLYEDENDNYNYESGIYSTINFEWNDDSQILTISDRKGNFPGMLNERTFSIVIVTENKGIGLPITHETDKIVRYTGKNQIIKLKN